MRSLAAANVVSFTQRRQAYAAENDRELSRQWIARLRADIKAGNLDVVAADKKGPVKLSSVLALAKSIASPRYRSFWRGGIYARQSAIGADPDVGLGDRQVSRVINFLVKAGYLERADQHVRKGRTCLLKPKIPAAKLSEPPDTMSDTPDKMSEESSDLKPINPKADSPLPPAEPRSEAVSGRARCSLSTMSQIIFADGAVQEAPKSEIIQLDTGNDSPESAEIDRLREQERGCAVDEKWREHLRRRLGDDVFRSWFAQARTLRIEGGVVTIAVCSRFMKSWIDREYADQLLAACRAHDATVTSIELTVGTLSP